MDPSYRALRSTLPKNIFKPYWPRALSLLFLQLLGVSLIVVACLYPLPWFYKLAVGLVIGYCWALGGLIGHELMHGSIIRSRKGQDIWGFFCFLPFFISPTFWRYWHNNLHHSHTQRTIMDPDAYPTLRIYKQSRYIQKMYRFTPGSGYKRSLFYFFFWFTFNTFVAQFYFRFRNRIFEKLDNKKVNIELAVIGLIHLSALYFIGPSNWVWLVAIPFAIQNYIPFSYISTNHNLSPLTKDNNVLANSLTVTNHPILEFLHINFGYHVEHHMFPTVSGVYLKEVHQAVKEKWPEDIQVMPKWQAMKALYKTARIYKNSHTLMNPLTGETYPTIVKPKSKSVATEVGLPMAQPAVEPRPLEL